jgi:putative PIN family toxin of toxin-antitoxin system
MRIVLDTNVVVSGFLFNGPPTDVLLRVTGTLTEVFSSEPLLDELSATLRKRKLQYRLRETGYTADSLLLKYRLMVTVVSLVEFLEPVKIRDPKDEMVLSTAYAANAKIIVTGDKDLLTLRSFSGIRILTPAEFLNVVSI